MNIYRVYLDGILLPVAPGKIQTKIGNKNKTIDLIRGSELNFLKGPSLTEYSFEVLLPCQPYSFAQYENGFKSIDDYLDKLEQLKTSRRSFLFKIMRDNDFGINMNNTVTFVSLEDYTITEDWENGLDRKVSIKLKKYIDAKTVRYEVATDANGEETWTLKANSQRVSDKEIPKEYTVTAGETLYDICQRELGDGEQYTKIARLNNIFDANNLMVGQVIKFE